MDESLGNVTGKKVTAEQRHFELFDRLPEPIRKALADAPYSMAVAEVLNMIEMCRVSGGMDDYQINELILARFRQYIATKIKEEAIRLYGNEHPQAGPPT